MDCSSFGVILYFWHLFIMPEHRGTLVSVGNLMIFILVFYSKWLLVSTEPIICSYILSYFFHLVNFIEGNNPMQSFLHLKLLKGNFINGMF